MHILKSGYELSVRGKLGLDPSDLPDEEINVPRFPEIAEAYIRRRVPNYTEIVEELDLFYLEEAVINYICYLICPTLPRRLNIEVKTLDTSWKKEKVDWKGLALDFLHKVEDALANIEFLEGTGENASIAGLITHEYDPIGGV